MADASTNTWRDVYRSWTKKRPGGLWVVARPFNHPARPYSRDASECDSHVVGIFAVDREPRIIEVNYDAFVPEARKDEYVPGYFEWTDVDWDYPWHKMQMVPARRHTVCSLRVTLDWKKSAMKASEVWT